MEPCHKSFLDGLDHGQQSSDPETQANDFETLAAETDSAHENTPDQHPKTTNTPASKEEIPQPDFLPTGWESRFADDGKVYSVDHNRKATTWLDPRKNYPWKKSLSRPDNLPNGWGIS